LSAVTGSLSPDGFSLNAAAAELDGIVRDVRRFSALEAPTAEIDAWHDEVRTAVALELAAALLLARCAAPVMPRFAARLAEALSMPDVSTWPDTVELVTAGATVTLADRVFFSPLPAAPAVPSPATAPTGREPVHV
jgi:methionyl-tRNA synthetase